MPTALDADPSMLDEHERRFVANIRKQGWTGTYVPADEVGPGFGYTTGFWLNFKFPELITFSMKSDIAHATYWHIYRELKAGHTFKVREPIDSIFENLNAVLLEVPKSQFEEYLGWSRWCYGGNHFECLQLVWPNPGGKFPWDFDMTKDFVDDQPDLTNGDWSGLRRQ
jgi:hypothetical protein